MVYRVALPKNKENFHQKAESQDSLSLPKITGNTGNKPASAVFGHDADLIERIIEDGRIIAVEICSKFLQAHVWLAFNDFDPQDGQAVFYGHELEFLKTKTAEQLREIHKVKLAFGVGSKVRQ